MPLTPEQASAIARARRRRAEAALVEREAGGAVDQGRFDDAMPRGEKPTLGIARTGSPLEGGRFEGFKITGTGPDDPELRQALAAKAAGYRDENQEFNTNDRVSSFLGNMIGGVPIIGPPIRRGAENVAAFIRAGMSGKPMQEELDFIRQRHAEVDEAHPGMATVGQIAGGIAGTIPMVAAAPAAFGVAPGMGLLSRMALGGVSGAAIGAADAVTRGTDPGEAAMLGGGLGLAFPAAGRAIGGAVRRSRARRAQRAEVEAAPTGDDLAAQAGAKFDEARASGIVLRPEPYLDFAEGLIGRLRSEGYDPQIHPGIKRGLERLIAQAGDNLSLNDIHIVRRVIREAGKDISNESQQRLSGIMTRELDNFLRGVRPSDTFGSDSVEGIRALQEGIEMWSRMSKGEIIEEAFERAKNAVGANYTVAGMETALRQQFRRIASGPLMGTFSPEERKVILEVVRGAPVRNAMRRFGKLAPASLLSSPISGGTVAGWMIGGPVGSAALTTAAQLSRTAAARGTIRAAERAGAMARSGPRSVPITPAGGEDVDAAVTRLLQSVAAPALRERRPLEITVDQYRVR